MTGTEPQLRDHVLAAARRPEVLAAVERVYGSVRAAIEQRQPVCQLSGRCCKFDEYGHRLYVSTLEMAAFVAALEVKNHVAKGAASRDRSLPRYPSGTCPFQIGKLCGVHTIRPFGCRMFFCDESATEWQQANYERFHAEIKSLHDELGVTYRYVEWRAALRELFPDAVSEPMEDFS